MSEQQEKAPTPTPSSVESLELLFKVHVKIYIHQELFSRAPTNLMSKTRVNT